MSSYRREYRTRPPNPRSVPKSHGKKPPAPKPHRTSGKSSSSVTAPIAGIAWALLILPFLLTAGLAVLVYR